MRDNNLINLVRCGLKTLSSVALAFLAACFVYAGCLTLPDLLKTGDHSKIFESGLIIFVWGIALIMAFKFSVGQLFTLATVFYPTIRTRPVKMAEHWMLVTTVLIAVFWGIYWLTVGGVPRSEFFQITIGSWIIPIQPLSISRWWDILIGLIWAPLLVYCFQNKYVKPNEDFRRRLLVYLGFLIGSLFVALGLVLSPGSWLLVASVWFMAIVLAGTVAFLGFWLADGLKLALVFEIFFSLIVALPFALILGLATGLSTIIFIWILPSVILSVVGLYYLLRSIIILTMMALGLIAVSFKLFVPHLYRSLYNWLMVLEDEPKQIKK